LRTIYFIEHKGTGLAGEPEPVYKALIIYVLYRLTTKRIIMSDDNKKFSGGRRYRNDDITVYWKPSACVHASYCYRELIEVFDPSSRPWVDMSGSTTERIIEVVNMCPTEALTWKWNDDEKNKTVTSDQFNHIKFRRPELIDQLIREPEESPVSVKVMTDGPIVIKGTFTLTYSGHTKEVKDSLISICRCGVSDHQPFCDGQHRKIGFNG
jgi:uncharacterized Fe-S cluster protein YjdI